MDRSIVVFCLLRMISCTLCSCTKTKTAHKVGELSVEINGQAAKPVEP